MDEREPDEGRETAEGQAGAEGQGTAEGQGAGSGGGVRAPAPGIGAGALGAALRPLH